MKNRKRSESGVISEPVPGKARNAAQEFAAELATYAPVSAKFAGQQDRGRRGRKAPR